MTWYGCQNITLLHDKFATFSHWFTFRKWRLALDVNYWHWIVLRWRKRGIEERGGQESGQPTPGRSGMELDKEENWLVFEFTPMQTTKTLTLESRYKLVHSYRENISLMQFHLGNIFEKLILFLTGGWYTLPTCSLFGKKIAGCHCVSFIGVYRQSISTLQWKLSHYEGHVFDFLWCLTDKFSAFFEVKHL